MQITYSYQSKEAVFDHETALGEVVIGRRKAGVVVDLDLTPDAKVSRPHARVWTEDGQYWIADLDSAHGTQVNGVEIKGQGRQRLQPGDTIRVGDTTLRVEIPVGQEDSGKTLPPEDVPDRELLKGITQSLDASEPVFATAETAATDAERRLALLYELPLQFGKETGLNELLQLIVERVVDVIPGAKRGVLLLVGDRTGGEFVLGAHLPLGEPAFSATLARRAMQRQEAFIWSRDTSAESVGDSAGAEMPGSVFEHRIESAMYAPLLWEKESLGVLCVDNCETCGAFSGADLRLLQAVAHHAAVAVANLQLQDKLKREVKALNNFMKLVSPQVAEQLKHRRGRIRLGGEYRDVTILFSDMRGFTSLSAQMEAEDVTEMLEDYFSRLVPIIFKQQGMVDKFVGDAIVAVFGSPQPDDQQHLHAIQAAVEMQTAMREVNTRRREQHKHTGELGIGIHCGEVVQGFIGSPERMEYTVIGDAVNRASRYCDGAGKGEVLISPEVYQRVWNSVKVKRTAITTKHEGDMKAYCIIDLKE